MSEMHDRLRQARKLAGYRSIKAATEAHRLVYSTYACHEGGSRPFKREAPRYAKLFRVNLTWLIEGTGSPKGRAQTHPVMELFDSIPPAQNNYALCIDMHYALCIIPPIADLQGWEREDAR